MARSRATARSKDQSKDTTAASPSAARTGRATGPATGPATGATGRRNKTISESASRPTKTTTRAAAAVEVKPASSRRAKKNPRQTIRCYLCGQVFEVSLRTMSTTCTGCHKAIKVEDVQVKSYLPVNDLQTCGRIKVTRRGRVAAKRLQSGHGLICEGSVEGSIETDGAVELGSRSSWKGSLLQSSTLIVADGATLHGHVLVPWAREEQEAPKRRRAVTGRR